MEDIIPEFICSLCEQQFRSYVLWGGFSRIHDDHISYPMAPGLKEVLESLPLGHYAVADAAYTLSECILIRYTGADIDPAQDSFNYYLFQLRICLEMAFGG